MARALRQKDADMTQGVIWKQLLQFAIPMTIGLLFQQLYNTVDTIVVGQFVGTEALAAVGSTGNIFNTMVGIAAGLSTGASVVISQSYGAHDHQRLQKAVHTSISLTMILSVILTVLGLVLVDPLLRMMDTPDDVFESASIYLSIYFAGLVGLLFYNMGSAILRAVGDSRRPLYFLCCSAVLNTLFDLLFVIVFHMGVEGVAYATILAQAISAVLVMTTLTREQSAYGVRWRKLCLDRQSCRDIMAVGVPTGFQAGVTSFSNVFVQGYINFFGSACMAGWSAYNKLDAFLMIPMQAISMTATTFVGQNYGAKNLKRARRGVTQSQVMSIGITAVLALIIIAFAPWFIRLFTSDPEVMTYGVQFIRQISPFYCLICINQILAGVLRGVGQANIPTAIMLFSYVVFRQVYLLVVKLLGNSLSWVVMAYPAGWVVACILVMIFYRRSVLYRSTQEPAEA